jgi:redox-sensitive bicupin YhaK (pirin superfamily)
VNDFMIERDSMTVTKEDVKKVLAVRAAPPPHWVGDGFPVRSMFSYDRSAAAMSPFLLLDYAPPVEFAPSTGTPRGVGEHPHRGFETVTIVYRGEVEHRDSGGNHGKIGPGDVQWMPAAAGVVHEEKHGIEFTRKGGTMEMVQLWVNLPARLKMSPPGYQDILDRNIPKVPLAEGAGTVRVIAGEFAGVRGPARTFTPVDLWDLRLKAQGRAELRLPAGHTTALLVLQGELRLDGSHSAKAAELATFAREGERLSLEARTDATVLLLSGEPIPEPVVGYGPFVMNTEAEIRAAVRDFQMGRMGALVH